MDLTITAPLFVGSKEARQTARPRWLNTRCRVSLVGPSGSGSGCPSEANTVWVWMPSEVWDRRPSGSGWGPRGLGLGHRARPKRCF